MLVVTDSLPRGLGYLEIDQRASGNGFFEADTYTCSHCCRVVVMNPSRKRERYRCGGCSHHICDDCAAEKVRTGLCRTMAQKIDEIRAQAERQAEAHSLTLP